MLALLPTDLTYREIAAQLDPSLNTVRTQAGRIGRKLGASTRDDAVSQGTAPSSPVDGGQVGTMGVTMVRGPGGDPLSGGDRSVECESSEGRCGTAAAWMVGLQD